MGPHVSYDVEQCIRYIRQLNEAAPIFALSAKTGDSLDEWVTWLLSA